MKKSRALDKFEKYIKKGFPTVNKRWIMGWLVSTNENDEEKGVLLALHLMGIEVTEI